MNLATMHVVTRWFYKAKLYPVAKLMYYLQFLLFNSSLPPSVKIGKGSKFAYGGIGVVVNERVEIKERCIIGQGVTLGGRGRKRPGEIIIDDGAYIGAGVRILGPVKIGKLSIVAPNSVVLEDVPDGVIVGGIPARIIKTGITKENQGEYV